MTNNAIIQAYRERINFLRRVHGKKGHTVTAEKAKITIAELEQRMSELKPTRFSPTDLERRVLLANITVKEFDFDAANLRDCLEQDEPIYLSDAVRSILILAFELALAGTFSATQKDQLRETLTRITSEGNEEQTS